MRKHVCMAIAYDFDGTLAPGNMQEHQFLPDIGMKAEDFWSEVKRVTKEHQADEVLVYMNLMLKKARAAEVAVRRDDFKAQGKAIRLFDGVVTWFDDVNGYAREKEINLAHFLITSGNAEIFAGTAIHSKFRPEHIYASKYMFDENGVAVWPALAVNYTTKTQFLFRINKGAHDLSDNTAVNKFVERKDRAIPFENIIFVGDGSTDIPCFRLVKEQGGLSIAVYQPNTRGAKRRAEMFLSEGRIHCCAPANYNIGAPLNSIVKAQIDLVAARARLLAEID